jgi:hypothetical protein
MSKTEQHWNYYIGQRVRINKEGNTNHGRDAVIVSELTAGPLLITNGVRIETLFYYVSVDGIGQYVKNVRLAFRPEHLDPIRPEGWKLVSWEDLAKVWKRPKED